MAAMLMTLFSMSPEVLPPVGNFPSNSSSLYNELSCLSAPNGNDEDDKDEAVEIASLGFGLLHNRWEIPGSLYCPSHGA
jgi:hypothetical protein